MLGLRQFLWLHCQKHWNYMTRRRDLKGVLGRSRFGITRLCGIGRCHRARSCHKFPLPGDRFYVQGVLLDWAGKVVGICVRRNPKHTGVRQGSLFGNG